MRLETAILALKKDGWEVTKTEYGSSARLDASKKGHRKISCFSQKGEITSYKVDSTSLDRQKTSQYESIWVGSLSRAFEFSKLWKEC